MAMEKSTQNKLFKASMKHDGRGLRFLKVLFRSHGSIIPRTIPVAIFSASLAVLLMLCKKMNLVDAAILPILRHPIAVQMLAIVLGYVTVLRTNYAVDRYFEGMTNVQFFGSKWGDAYTQLCAFVRSSVKLHTMKGAGQEMLDDLEKLQHVLLHWFSILHALAINELQVTQLDAHDDVFVKRIEPIAIKDIPNFDNLFSSQGTDEVTGVKGGFAAKSCIEHGLAVLPVIGELTPQEIEALNNTENAKVDLVHSWIIEAVASASLEGRILTQPPILSRVYQELSNGMLGFNQAYKIALVQFPFAFAQMLTLFLVAFLFCCPVAVYVFTGGEFLTPALTLFTVLGFWGIHEIAVEIENPFGTGVNHLPLTQLHETVTETLVEVTVAKCPIFT